MKLLHLLTFSIILLLGQNATAQDTIRQFCDRNLRPNKTVENYDIQRIAIKSPESQTWAIFDYDRQNRIYMTSGATDRTFSTLIGNVTVYYPNGQKKTVGKYLNNLKVGEWKGFLDNGDVDFKGRYENDKKVGEWAWFHSNGKPSAKETYLQDSLVSWVYFNLDGTTHKDPEIADHNPILKDTSTNVRRFIATRVEYPDALLEKKIQGTVLVDCIVDLKGNVTNVNIIQSVDPILDSEALDKVLELPTFIPATYKNRKIPVHYVIPVKFKI